MTGAELVALLLPVLQDAPELIAAVKQLVADLEGGSTPAATPMTPEVVAAMSALNSKLAQLHQRALMAATVGTPTAPAKP